MSRLAGNGSWVATLELGDNGQVPTGLAPDSRGKVWAVNRDSSNVMRIDPNDADPANPFVDKTVPLNLPPGQYHGDAAPYNYSDMTGVNLFATIAPAGVWTAVCDSESAGTVWDHISWTADAGVGTISVQARAVNQPHDFGREVYLDVANGVSLIGEEECAVAGRYLQVRVQLNAHCHDDPKPTLQGLTVYSASDPAPDQDADGVPDCADNCVPEPNPDQQDCNTNGLGDACEIAQNPSLDSNDNCILDGCEIGVCCLDGISCAQSQDLTLPECNTEPAQWFFGEFCGVDGFECPNYLVCGTSAEDCYTEHLTPGCSDVDCCQTVCVPVYDYYCCQTEWDSICVDKAEQYCCTGIIQATPASGSVDARQPHQPSNPLPRQGIGAVDNPNNPNDPGRIKLTLRTYCLDPVDFDLFELCETKVDPLLGPNRIMSVTDIGGTSYVRTYEVTLHHAITAGGVTTIRYKPDGSLVAYTSHPANVNADSMSAPSDILRIIDYLNHVLTPPYGVYSTDTDHSAAFGPPDILRVIDLLNGAGAYDPWLNTPLPQNTSCPPPPAWVACGCEGGEALASGGCTDPSTLGPMPAPDNQEFMDGFVKYVTTTACADSASENDFTLIVNALADFCVLNLSAAERKSLAEALRDPSLTFASPVAAKLVPEIVSRLLE